MDRRYLRNLDYWLLVLVVAILGLSLFVLSSATVSEHSDALYYVKRQLLWVVLGTVMMVMVVSVNYSHLRRYATPLYLGTLVMLGIVLVLGSEAKGAQRWINLGPFVLQPSEFAKVTIVVAMAQFLAVREGKLQRFRDLLPCFFYVLLPLLLILRQPDLGTSLVLIGILLGMLLIAGARPLLLAGLVAVGLILVIGAIMAHYHYGLPLPLEDYQLRRLTVFLNPYNDGMGGRGAGYHVIQSQIAIGSGGLWGKGLFQGSQVQLSFLPEHHTDFIFSVVGEELGFIGTSALLLLYALLLYRAVRVAAQAKDLFGTLLVTGITSMITFHLLVNVGMTVGVMPVTGLPLPFFSSGGSSLLSNMIGLGLILNVNLRRQKIMF